MALSRPPGVYLGAVWSANGIFSPRIEQKMNFVKFRLIKISFLFFERIEQNGTRFLLNSEKGEKSRADPRAPSSTAV